MLQLKIGKSIEVLQSFEQNCVKYANMEGFAETVTFANIVNQCTV